MPDYSTKEFEKKRAEKLTEKLKKIKREQQEKEAKAKASLLGFPYIDLTKTPIEKEALALISEKEARETKTLAFYKVKDVIKVAAVNPESKKSKEVVKKLEEETGYQASIFLISEPSFDHGVEVYKQIVIPVRKEEVGLTKEALEAAQKEIKNLADLKKKIKKVSITEIVNVILAGAIASNASDIHIEPEKESIELRYRIDGILHNVATLSKDIYHQLLSRVKLTAGLKINVTDIPQDGRITVKLDEREIDLRISTLPTGYGESTVMRLLGVGAVGLKVTELGLKEREQKLLLELIKKPTGMILTTGPTGSGKTTTLYSFINQIKSPEVKIITLENPIEYRLEGIQQTPIDPEKGMSFASGLRAILRQDPDVIMVGEIRDLETAEIAAQAALTGHLVFSTLHTNDASGAIPRLINMGLRPFTLGPALIGVIGQRLVRRLCPDCKEVYKPNKETIQKLKKELGKLFPKEGVKKLYKAKGCTKCGDIGYRGRIGIYEVIEVTKEIEELINQRAPASEIFNLAAKQGMITMRQDGLLKVIEGITSLDEVDRVS
jgi:type IV pilus assembly protein PilB